MKTTAPNILWICTDQQRYDTLGCTGNPFVRTPNIDRLAREGVLFENAFCQNPLCTPSRGSFLTGRYPSTNRLRQNGQNCPPDLMPLPRILRDKARYVCGLSGKLHLSACDNRLLLGPEWWRQMPDQFFRGSEPRIDDGYAVFHWDHAPSGSNPCSAYTQWVWEKAKRRVETPLRKDSKVVHEGMPEELHQTTFCVEKAITFIELMKEKPYPWLFSVNIFDPHPHFDPPTVYLERYLDRLDELPLPNYVEGEISAKPRHHAETRAKQAKSEYADLSERDHRHIRASYYAMVDLIDVQIGRLLAALDASGQRDNTLIIFMSDHGELLGDHGLWPKGPFLYDCSTRVPLIFNWRGRIVGHRRASGLVELTDIAPTLLEACGLPKEPAMQGQSLWQQLTQANASLDPIREDIYCEYANSNPHTPSIYLNMVRTATHKLIAHHNQHDGELYDLVNDPGENRNLWNDPASLPLRAQMLSRLAARMAFTADPMPPRVGVY